MMASSVREASAVALFFSAAGSSPVDDLAKDNLCLLAGVLKVHFGKVAEIDPAVLRAELVLSDKGAVLTVAPALMRTPKPGMASSNSIWSDLPRWHVEASNSGLCELHFGTIFRRGHEGNRED